MNLPMILNINNYLSLPFSTNYFDFVLSLQQQLRYYGSEERSGYFQIIYYQIFNIHRSRVIKPCSLLYLTVTLYIYTKIVNSNLLYQILKESLFVKNT